MIIPIIVAYITACLLGLYFLYRHRLNTPPDTWPEKWRGNQRNPRKNRLEPISQYVGARSRGPHLNPPPVGEDDPGCGCLGIRVEGVRAASSEVNFFEM